MKLKHFLFAGGFILLIITGRAAFADTDPLVYMPFEEGQQWYCVQGDHGYYSHYGNQTWGYDFTLGSSSRTFGQPIYSPVNGYVRVIRRDIRDNWNNSGSNASNNWGWGNTIVIEADRSDYYVRIAHMRYNSIPYYFYEGMHINQGDFIGRVGNSGYSTEAHLHMQVQESERGPSVEFDFVEGDIDTYDWVRSQLAPGKYVIDDDYRANLGAPITRVSNWWNGGSFRTWNWARGAVGDNYRTSDSYSRFYWGFNVLVNANYDVYVSCRWLRNRERNAYYRFYGPGSWLSRTIDQRHAYGYHYIGSTFLRYGNRYYMRVRGGSTGRLCADGVILWRR